MCAWTYSAESAGKMDIGERWELQSQRGEKDMVRTSRTPRLLSYTNTLMTLEGVHAVQQESKQGRMRIIMLTMKVSACTAYLLETKLRLNAEGNKKK